jgi:uncharacterized protein
MIVATLPVTASAGLEQAFLYHPQAYSREALAAVPGNIVRVEYRTIAGPQVAWYIPPENGSLTPPPRLWLLFAGNGSLALDWLALADGQTPDPDAGYLLIDYPGYGLCAGTPSEPAIVASCEAAVSALAALMHVRPAVLHAHVGVMGHSLGAAVAVRYAAAHPVRRMVLIAPFTSINDMGRTAAGWLGAALVSNSFNNRAHIRAIMNRNPAPQVLILHGTADRVIPVSMGRALAAICGDSCQFIEIPGADHNSILLEARDRVWDFMRDESRPPDSIRHE